MMVEQWRAGERTDSALGAQKVVVLPSDVMGVRKYLLPGPRPVRPHEHRPVARSLKLLRRAAAPFLFVAKPSHSDAECLFVGLPRNPAVGNPCGPPDGGLAMSTQPDRWASPLCRLREDGYPGVLDQTVAPRLAAGLDGEFHSAGPVAE